MVNNFILAGCDTDAIMFLKPDGKPFSKEEQLKLIQDLNSQYGGGIEFDNEGLFETVICWKSKNYYMRGEKKGKPVEIYKGSSIKDQKKEPALKEFQQKLLHSMETHTGINYDEIIEIYMSYIIEAINVKDIKRWAQKKTVSKKILNSSEDGRKNETDVLDVIKDKNFVEGDKIYVFRTIDGEVQEMKKGEPVFYKNGTPKMKPRTVLRLIEDWSNDHIPLFFIERIYKTICIFETLIDMSKIPTFHKKSDKHKLEQLIKEVSN